MHPISNLHLSIHLSILPLSQTYTIHSSIHPSGKRKAFTSDLSQNSISKSLPPPQIPLSWLLNCGCHCSPLKCCSRGPNIASYSTIDKCSGVQNNLYLKLTKKNYLKLTKKKISQTYTFHPSIHLTYHKTVSRTYTIYPSIYPSFHPSIYLTYHKNYLHSYI